MLPGAGIATAEQPVGLRPSPSRPTVRSTDRGHTVQSRGRTDLRTATRQSDGADIPHSHRVVDIAEGVRVSENDRLADQSFSEADESGQEIAVVADVT